MPQIIPIKDLKNTAEISELCHRSEEPVYITKNGYGDMVIMSIENYERAMKKLRMYQALETSERQIKEGSVKEHLLACIEKAYDRLEENPYQFPECRDAYLKSLKYREVILTDMSYLMIVKVVDLEVYIMGIFHQLEDYGNKLS